MADIELVIT